MRLNDTLYARACGLWPAIGQRINAYMMERLGQGPEAVRLLGYLEAAGVLDSSLFSAGVAGARALLAGGVGDLEAERDLGRAFDHRQALEFMDEVLGRLTG